MKRFKSPRHVQRFLSIHDPINNLFHLRRNSRPATECRAARAQAFAAWAEIAGASLAAWSTDFAPLRGQGHFR